MASIKGMVSMETFSHLSFVILFNCWI